jgi:hypothetical protein
MSDYVGDYPLLTNHSRYARLGAESADLVNAVTGSQRHVWLDMLVSFVPCDDEQGSSSRHDQCALYVNWRSNLCAFARPAPSGVAVHVESASRLDCPYPPAPVFYRLSVHLAYLPQPTGSCFAVYVDGDAVDWPGGESLPGLPASGGHGPWLRCVPGSTNLFPGLAIGGYGYVDDLVVTDRYALPASNLLVRLDGCRNLLWASDFGRRYQVEACTNPIVHDWRSLGDPVLGTGQTNRFDDTTNRFPARFYRVKGIDP